MHGSPIYNRYLIKKYKIKKDEIICTRICHAANLIIKYLLYANNSFKEPFGYNKMTWNPNIKSIKGEMHRYFLRLAYKYAWENSHDPVTKNGTIIVDQSIGKVIAYGTNHFPEGLDFTEEQTNDREWKYKHIIHAEYDVIENAEALDKNIEGFTMYCPWISCKPCAEKIIESGIRNLIGHKAMIMKTPERWWESINSAFKLLEKSNIGIYMYDGKIGGIESLFDHSIWEP